MVRRGLKRSRWRGAAWALFVAVPLLVIGELLVLGFALARRLGWVPPEPPPSDDGREHWDS